jgi:opacity protein-like surface antigen
MKLYTVVGSVLVACLAAGASAQDAFHFGALGGATLSSVSFSPPPLFETNSRTVGNAGVFVNYGWNDRFSFDARLMWVKKSVVLATSLPGADSGRTNMSYVTLPVLLKARIGAWRLRPYVVAGPEAQLKRGQATTTYRQSGIERELAGFDQQFRSWDVAVNVGAGLEIPAGPLSMVLEGMYSHGLRNIVATDRSDFDAIKTRSLRLGAGLRF